MSETVTLHLPDTVAQSARALAVQTHRPVEDVLLEWLDRAAADIPIEALPDNQILALRDLQMSDADQAELSDLLAHQREGALDNDGRNRLDILMTSYRRGMVKKAQALKVSVDRGLQPPLN